MVCGLGADTGLTGVGAGPVSSSVPLPVGCGVSIGSILPRWLQLGQHPSAVLTVV